MRPSSCPPQTMSPLEPSRSIWQAIAPPLPVVLALILLPTIAFASPPDPSWVAGFYDGADGDDIVSLVYETSTATADAPPHLGPPPCLLGISLESVGRHVPGRHFTRGPRSPPILRSSEFAYAFNSLPPPSGPEALITLPSIVEALSTRPRSSHHPPVNRRSSIRAALTQGSARVMVAVYVAQGAADHQEAHAERQQKRREWLKMIRRCSASEFTS